MIVIVSGEAGAGLRLLLTVSELAAGRAILSEAAGREVDERLICLWLSGGLRGVVSAVVALIATALGRG